MRKLFYTRLALSNIRRNRKFYLPYMLTCICTIAMFYIIDALNAGHMLDNMRGEMVLRSYMAVGGVVIAIFAIIFLFYTNSFLTRRRRYEFGLYNILGMEKRHIARVMLMETLFIGVVSLALGIAAGAGMAKAVALTALKLIQADAVFGFEFVPGAALRTLIVFAGIFVFSYLVELLRMRRSSAIDLLRSAEHGEREPKTRWLMTLLGLACMGGGYYIAVTTEDPVEAVMLFLVAVVLVILGTYMVLTNALKYTPEGGTIRIRMHALRADALVIEDTGVGIRPEDLPRVFEKGYTGVNGREGDRRATGIGLYLCRRILSRLGHGIEIESAPDRGTRVILSLDSLPLEVE